MLHQYSEFWIIVKNPIQFFFFVFFNESVTSEHFISKVMSLLGMEISIKMFNKSI